MGSTRHKVQLVQGINMGTLWVLGLKVSSEAYLCYKVNIQCHANIPTAASITLNLFYIINYNLLIPVQN